MTDGPATTTGCFAAGHSCFFAKRLSVLRHPLDKLTAQRANAVPMQILITNDDGYTAPGLKALYDAVKPLGNVTVVAPAVCHSSKGHAVEVKRNITVHQTTVEGIGPVHVVDSSPGDCTRMGLQIICETPPDLVVAGINPGANLGVDVYYSGTVAAAREAAMASVPAIAVSRYMRKDVPMDWNEISQLANAAIARLRQESIDPTQFWNLNLPAVSNAPVKGFAFVGHSTEPQGLGYEAVTDGDGQTEYAFVGNYQGRAATQPADVRYIFDGYITATKLQLGSSASDAAPVVEPF
ncbi:5'/3'-nucleotidase SurE [bacterium]|nr:5'/3'-nucleotidase SurE [bacterium]